MGTPEAAVPTLRALSRHHDIALVVTQPDRPQGRSKQPVAPAVKKAAGELGLSLAQPENRSDLQSSIGEAGPFDLGVVVAFGRILRPEVLRLPTHGLLNVHFSLLPRWRGAAPVERALMAGDPMSGVTIMQMDEGLDTGAVVTAQAIDIGSDENAGGLTARLADLGARLLVNSIGSYLSGELAAVVQTDDGATYAEKIGPGDRPIRPSDDVDTVINQVRGLAPDPAATLSIDGQPHKILQLRTTASTPPQGSWQIIDGIPLLGLADGGVEIVTIQPPGRKTREGAAWARGRRETAGVVS